MAKRRWRKGRSTTGPSSQLTIASGREVSADTRDCLEVLGSTITTVQAPRAENHSGDFRRLLGAVSCALHSRHPR